MLNWTATVERYISEGRTVSGGKGDSTAKDAEKSQAAFTTTLQNAFKTQFATQQNVLKFLTGKMEAGITNPQGYDAATKSALNTNVIQDSATNFQNALKTAQAIDATHGGKGLPSGVQEQITGQLAGAQANSESAGLNQVQQQDAQLKQQNYWNSVNALNGTAAQINPLGYAGGANSGSGAVAGLSEAYSQSQQTGFLNTLGNSFAGTLGKTLGGGNMTPGSGWLGA